MRTLALISVLAVAGLCSTTKPACPEANAPASTDKQVMNLGCGKIEGQIGGPGAEWIPGGMPTEEKSIVMERSFVSAIQGNMDRETVEYRNGERD